MPLFQFPIAVTLATCSLLSLALFGLSTSKHGGIALPITSDSPLESRHDPFDVTLPDDIIDGEPIDEEKFWVITKLRGALLVIAFTVIVSLQTVTLGYAISSSSLNTKITCLLHVLFAVYLSLLSAQSVGRNTVHSHTRNIIHLFVLTTLAFVLLAFTALVPSDRASVSSLAEDSQPHILQVLWYMVLCLYGFSTVVVVTTPLGPPQHYPVSRIYSEKVVASITNKVHDNVSGITGASIWDTLLFSYTTKVVMLGNTITSLDIGDLPIVPGYMRATYIFRNMRSTLPTTHLRRFMFWNVRPGSGWELAFRLAYINRKTFTAQMALAATGAVLSYAPQFFLMKLVRYLETDPERHDRSWGWLYSFGMFATTASLHLILIVAGLVYGQLWSLSATTLHVSIRVQLNSILFAKTLVRKDVASSSGSSENKTNNYDNPDAASESSKKEDEDDFTSKAQVMTLMTTDVDRVSEFGRHVFTLVDSPIEIIIGTIFLYELLGSSAFIGLAVTCLFLPLNHLAGKIIVGAQDRLMKARDERIALMNEILGAIRMLKFMAWERKFEKRVLRVREKELKFQKLNYMIEVLWGAIWEASPMVVTLVAFFHFAVIKNQILTPSVAFASSLISLRRIEKYLHATEIAPVPPLAKDLSSVTTTPKTKFMLMDLNIVFPKGELSLVCGKFGSGKTLLLLALLGEADFLTGQVLCPKTPPDAIASFVGIIPPPDDGSLMASTTWLRNASIKENILFNLPYVEERYQRTLEVCALVNDLMILEDGDESEIGERGAVLPVSLARAVYSRASILLLDDVLSAVDAHTAHHLYFECLKGDLMRGRTVILVSHHVQLCAPGASYVVALEYGRVLYKGDLHGFQSSGVINSLAQSGTIEPTGRGEAEAASSEANLSGTVTPLDGNPKPDKKSPRKLVEEEARAVGRIDRSACGGISYWIIFAVFSLLANASPIAQNGWLSYWSGASQGNREPRSPMFYIEIYALVSLILATACWYILYTGSIHMSTVLYKKLLETVLFVNIRFHDTVSRGRLLNRFGNDFEGVDSSLSGTFGITVMCGLSVFTTLLTISVVGGPQFFLFIAIICLLYWNSKKFPIIIIAIYGQTSRDLRRLDSVSRSPLYSMYGETISGVTILRAFGASSKFMRDMLRCVDTSCNTFPVWFVTLYAVNIWLSVRFELLSSVIVGLAAFVTILTPSIDAALAGFILAFASTVTNDVQQFVSLEQSMVALERIKEYSELQVEAPEFVEPRPPASWPTKGEIVCEDLVIRYAPELPDVLHNLDFSIKPGEKVGILGRTGSGKSTLALSFFRFVEATAGRIRIDGLDISKIGLTDLRSKLTIIPQDPTILSGTLRSTLDVFEEYQDAEIVSGSQCFRVNTNVFRDLDSPVSEGGENFSTGEKQLLCMARAIIKRSKVLVMDEVSVYSLPVDYATDELISQTIRREFAESTILTIAHRLRTVIDYDRVMLLNQGRIVEFDSPATLLSNHNSKFYSLCKATGKHEFSVLKRMAGVQ
ncbi:ATP-binding cassette transporter [Lactifluus volemus]|nr:ATP-binding cassette transporter [Lactifluus volemus]